MKDLYHRQWASFGSVCVCGFVPLTRSTCLSTYVGQRRPMKSVASRRYPTHGQSITSCMYKDSVKAVVLYDLLQSKQSVHCCTLPHLGLPDGTHRLASALSRIFYYICKKNYLYVSLSCYILQFCVTLGCYFVCGIIDSMHTFKPSSLFLCVRQL